MKYLTNYTENGITVLLQKYGGFFAFGDDQFREAKNPNIKKEDYCGLGSGLICPKTNAKKLLEGINKNYEDGIKQDIKENGKEAIIIRELYNHEAFYTGRIDSTTDALKDYKITESEIITLFFKEKKEKDIEPW